MLTFKTSVTFYYYTYLSSLLFLIPLIAAASNQECESEIRSKSALVSKLEDKTMEISRMLMRLDQRGPPAPAPNEKSGGADDTAAKHK